MLRTPNKRDPASPDKAKRRSQKDGVDSTPPPQAKYCVAGEGFSSKKAVLTRGQGILQATPVGAWVKGQDLAFLQELLERYREARRRGECKAIVGVEVEPNSIGSWKGFRAHYADGTSGDLSYRNAANSLNGYDPHPAQVRAAMREAVSRQILDFRYEEIGRGEDPDFAMNSGLSEVDHCTPWQFCDLVDAFLEGLGITFQDIELEKHTGFRGSFLPKPLARWWKAFHREHAVLELITKEEHQRRTKARRGQKKDPLAGGSHGNI